MWNLKNRVQINLYTKQKSVMDIENKLMVTRPWQGWGWGGQARINWEIGIDIFTLPYVK